MTHKISTKSTRNKNMKKHTRNNHIKEEGNPCVIAKRMQSRLGLGQCGREGIRAAHWSRAATSPQSEPPIGLSPSASSVIVTYVYCCDKQNVFLVRVDTGEKIMLQNVNFDHFAPSILTSRETLQIVEGLSKTMLYITRFQQIWHLRHSVTNRLIL